MIDPPPSSLSRPPPDDVVALLPTVAVAVVKDLRRRGVVVLDLPNDLPSDLAEVFGVVRDFEQHGSFAAAAAAHSSVISISETLSTITSVKSSDNSATEDISTTS